MLKSKVVLLESCGYLSMSVLMFGPIYAYQRVVEMHTVLAFEAFHPEFVCMSNGKRVDNSANRLSFARNHRFG